MRRMVGILSVLTLLLPQPGFSAPKTITVPWNQLEPLILGERVQIELPDATILGPVIAITADALTVEVLTTSRPDIYPRGSTTLQRSSLTSLELRRPRSRLLLLFMTWGSLGGAVVFASTDAGKRNRGLAQGLILGLPVTMAFLAQKLRIKKTVIQIQKQPEVQRDPF